MYLLALSLVCTSLHISVTKKSDRKSGTALGYQVFLKHKLTHLSANGRNSLQVILWRDYHVLIAQETATNIYFNIKSYNKSPTLQILLKIGNAIND